MGILNVTPDSFSDGGKFFGSDSAIAQGQKLVEDGADILDIGGESTRPFSKEITEEEEIRRVVPIIEHLAARINIPISIDTTKSGVARRALDAGASIINDIGAFRMDGALASLAAEREVPVILMHMKGMPGTMQINPQYDDLMGEVKAFLSERVDFAIQKGIEKSKIIIDPGIGFGKNIHHNLQLVRDLNLFGDLNVPILIGPSRKAFIRKTLKYHFGKEFSSDQPEVETGTQAIVSASILNGAHIVRVHDVANTVVTARMADAIRLDI
ncbi:MAG: dihydropteroate synthase [Desulfobacterales bacterium]